MGVKRRIDSEEDVEIRVRVHPENLAALAFEGESGGLLGAPGLRLRPDGAYELWLSPRVELPAHVTERPDG